MSSNLEIKRNFDELENSEIFQPSRVGNEKGLTLISIADYMDGEKIGKEYLDYCGKTGMSAGRTAGDYLSSIRRDEFKKVLIPTDLSDYKAKNGKNITDKQRKGLLKFFKFLETKKMASEFNGYPLTVWRSNLSISEYGDENKASRIKDLTASEVFAARERCKDSVKDYFSLLAYSGARHAHLYEALKKQRHIEHPAKGVIAIDVKDLSIGTKLESKFYFPAGMEETLKKYKHPYSIDNMQKEIAQSGTEGRPVNAASLRKWNYNMMLTGDAPLSETAADHIQGRSPKSVGARHYANLDKIAAEGYGKIVSKFLKALPLN